MLFSKYLNSNPLVWYATDIGQWKMVITDTEGNDYTFKGSLCGRVTVGNTNLTYYLREQIPVDDLLVFGARLIRSDEEE
jgi:hypothetical protein